MNYKNKDDNAIVTKMPTLDQSQEIMYTSKDDLVMSGECNKLGALNILI